MRGEDRVSDFMWQDRVENSIRRALNGHFPTMRPAVFKEKARDSSCADIPSDLDPDRAWLIPCGQLPSQPFDRQITAERLGRASNRLRELGGWCRHNEVWRTEIGPTKQHDDGDDETAE
jgi:hypothetical protein